MLLSSSRRPEVTSSHSHASPRSQRTSSSDHSAIETDDAEGESAQPQAKPQMQSQPQPQSSPMQFQMPFMSQYVSAPMPSISMLKPDPYGAEMMNMSMPVPMPAYSAPYSSSGWDEFLY